MSDVPDETLLDTLDRARASGDAADDIAHLRPGITPDDGYRLQLAYKKRLAERGDAHVGFRISTTSRNGVAEAVELGLVPREALERPIQPMFTALSASNLAGPDRTVRRRPGRYLYLEGEVVFVMARPLAGPGVTAEAARAAVGSVHAGLDMAQIPHTRIFGLPHTLAAACSPDDTTIVVGAEAHPPTMDLRTEGILVSVDGRERASATAWETLGGPLVALAWLANKLGELGGRIEAGHIVITGVCAYPQRIAAGDHVATAEFTRLGSVSAVVVDWGE